MASTTPPTGYLNSRGVTDLNRQYLWNTLSDAEKAKYESASTSTGTGSTTTTGSGTTSGTGTTTGSGSTTKTGKGFVSLGSNSDLSQDAFKNRIDTTRSATLTAETIAAFGSLWENNDELHEQLGAATNPDGTPRNGGAIFVTVRAGSTATGTRPYDGKSGPLDSGDAKLKRGENPYGYFSTDPAMSETPFVQRRVAADGTVTDTAYDASSGKSYSEWLKSAKYAYDEYETLVGKQETTLLNNFGGLATQGLLGYDVNDDGIINNETELFGFDLGLDIDGSFSVKSESDSTTTFDFTFLTADGRLTGDPLDANQTDEQKAEMKEYYRRFMIVTPDGKSTSLLQSNAGYNNTIGQYVAAQAMLTFGEKGASLTAVTQAGLRVTA